MRDTEVEGYIETLEGIAQSFGLRTDLIRHEFYSYTKFYQELYDSTGRVVYSEAYTSTLQDILAHKKPEVPKHKPYKTPL